MTLRKSEVLRLMVLTTVVLVTLSGTGCWPSKQGRDLVFDEVTFNISAIAHEGDDNENQWQIICDVLNRYGEFDCQEVERTNCQQVGSVRVCDYEGVTLFFDPPLSLTKLQQLHSQLLALDNNGVTLGLRRGSLTAEYIGLTAEGTISIKIRIAVTPGATLYVERRWTGICEKVTTTDNVFHDEISLRKAQEWVFYRTELKTGRDTVQRYFRLNIMSKREEELSQTEFDRLITRP